MSSAASRATPEPNPEVHLSTGSPPVQSAEAAADAGAPKRSPEQGTVAVHPTKPGKHSLLEKLEDSLSGPLIVRVIVIALVVMGALAVSVTQLREAWEKWRVHPVYTEPDLAELTGAFDARVSECKQDKDKCIAAALDELPQKVQSKPGDYAVAEGLFADQVMGEIVRTRQEAMDLLHTIYGVDSGFLAVGISKPSDQQTFFAGRIPEYLAPNYPDSHEGVLVWKLTPMLPLEDEKLYDILRKTAPINAKEEEAEKEWLIVDKRLARWQRNPEVVVRFALIPKGTPKGGYSGCLGRTEAHEVFVDDFGLMRAYGFTLKQATKMSGYPLPPNEQRELYAFVFIPSDPQELHVPTWTYVLSHVKSDLEGTSPCKPS